MPDISMCTCHSCPLAKDCYRYTATPNGRQTYADFAPNKDGDCQYFWDNEEYQTEEL